MKWTFKDLMRFKWALICTTLVMFIASRIYEKCYPDDDGTSMRETLASLIPGLIVSVYFRIRIGKQLRNEKEHYPEQ